VISACSLDAIPPCFTIFWWVWIGISASLELGKSNHEEKKLSKGSIPFNGQNVQLVHWWVLVQHCGQHTLLFNHLIP
jgi:hypothetical protein